MAKKTKPTTVADLLHRFLEHCDARVVGGTLAVSSRYEIGKRVEDAHPLFAVRLDALGDAQLDRWMHGMRGTPGKQRNASQVLRQAFLWGRTEGLVVGDPTVAIRKLAVRRAKPGEPLSREQLLAFIAACEAESSDHRGRTLHLSALHVARSTASADCLAGVALSGVRTGGLGGALVDNFHEERRLLRIKTKGAWRCVPLSRPLTRLLCKRRELVRGHHAYLFPGQRDRGLGSQSLNTAFHRLAVKAGLPASHHANDLRHTAVTLGRMSGMTWLEAAEFAGHDDPETTRRVYDHTDVTPAGLALADGFAAFLGVSHV
jgi:integrase